MKSAERSRQLFSHRIDAAEASAVREILKVTEKPEIIPFAGGLPAPEFFPTRRMAAAFSEAILEDGRAFGIQPLKATLLRQWIAEERMAKRGIQCSPIRCWLQAGPKAGTRPGSKNLIDSGDKVIVERPTYLAALQVFLPV